LTQSLRTILQSKIDNYSKRDLEDVLPIPTPILIPLPSIVSNFLNKCHNSSLEETLDSMREAFKDTKRAITNWETRMRRITTKSEEQKIKNEIYQSIAAAIEKEKNYEILLSVSNPVIEDSIAFLGGVPGPATAKATPSIIKDGVDFI
jgi:phosphatidylinositol kinase/protein kinase (PI-3  family)